ncbi:MFS transporter [Halostreptopolyspora alba]|uniref:MFS transporter n=1 Tax=Halostreptopolyspora alba TaxID=2487137 RepID=A0A3N0EGP4_9ACTN|nr:MFS transporter [Nocardiopsaceae bacterium YIM 96095]
MEKPGDVRTSPTAERPRRVFWLLAAGVGLAALNLRTGITSVGPVLNEITVDLGMSGALAGVLTTLPVLCFAVFGGATPTLIRRFGEHRVLVVALLALTVGLATRVLTGDPWLFLTLTALALSGGAIGNVLVPTLVKQHFPDRIGTMTTLYTTALAVGTTVAAAATVPVERASGSWHLALGMYAAFGVIAVIPWLLVLHREPPRPDPAEALGLGEVLRTGTGWQSVFFFGSQSAVAYIMFGWYAQFLRDNGLEPATAGLALSYLTFLAIPIALVLPGLMARVRDHRGFVGTFYACYAVGVTGLWLAPLQGVWLWTTFIGVGMGTFTLALTFFAVRTRTSAGTAAMSATSQGLGYLMGGAGPFLFGTLHDLTDAWNAPLAMVLGLTTLNLVVGMLLGRPHYLEDRLTTRSGKGATSAG